MARPGLPDSSSLETYRANARPPWAVAGRNQSKLQEVVRSLPADLREPELIIADAGDAGSLAKMCEHQSPHHDCRPLCPLRRGTPRGVRQKETSYCDITGEPAFVSKSIEQHHEAAKARGIRIVHCCGFDSIPAISGRSIPLRNSRATVSRSMGM